MTQPLAHGHQLAVLVLYNGDVKEVAYEPHQTVQALLQHAKQSFGVVSNHLLSLFTSNGTELPDTASVEDAGVTPGEKFVLGQSVVRGG